jgi:hypothetical protein
MAELDAADAQARAAHQEHLSQRAARGGQRAETA